MSTASQVLPSGKFLRVQSVGRHLLEDDALALELASSAEHRWRNSHPQVSFKYIRGKMMALDLD